MSCFLFVEICSSFSLPFSLFLSDLSVILYLQIKKFSFIFSVVWRLRVLLNSIILSKNLRFSFVSEVFYATRFLFNWKFCHRIRTYFVEIIKVDWRLRKFIFFVQEEGQLLCIRVGEKYCHLFTYRWLKIFLNVSMKRVRREWKKKKKFSLGGNCGLSAGQEKFLPTFFMSLGIAYH